MPKQSNRPHIGVDLGGTNIQAGVVDSTGKILARNKTKTKAEEGAAAVLARINDVARGAAKDAGVKWSAIHALGIGAPGAVDIHTGKVLVAVNLRWTNYPLARELGKLVKMPVVVDNDVNVATWGAHQAGAGKGFRDLLGVWVGTGIGGGLILNDALFHGFSLSAGEIGHTIVHADAPRGRRTLENVASRTSMVALLTQLIAAHHPSKITEITGGDLTAIRSKVLAKAFAQRDPLTVEVVTQAARYVGIAIANAVTLLSLPCVVVGGGVTDSLRQPWIKLVRESFEEHVFPTQLKSCKVVGSILGDDAAVIGAALLARERLAQIKI